MRSFIVAGILLWSFQSSAQNQCYRTCQAYVEKGMFDTLSLETNRSLETATKSWACKQTFEQLKSKLDVSVGLSVLDILGLDVDVNEQESKSKYEQWCRNDQAVLALTNTVKLFHRVAPQGARDVFTKCVTQCSAVSLSELRGEIKNVGGNIEVLIRRYQTNTADQLTVANVATHPLRPLWGY